MRATTISLLFLVAVPRRRRTRTPIQTAGGNPPPSDCSGTYTYDLGARIASGVDPRLVAGATVRGQFWSRDPMSTSYPSGLTGGIRLDIGL